MHRWRSALSKAIARPDRRSHRQSRPGRPGRLEVLESRELLSTFTVTSLGAAGAGSLRQAIIASNQNPGPDTIDFAVAGTIRVGRRSLPAITDPVNIDGTSAPTFAGSPVVTVDFQGSQGLTFALNSDGSTLRSLALVRAGGAGVTLNASGVTVQGNRIGLLADGTTPAGNRGDGIRINPSSHGDLIGQVDPVSGVTYYNSDSAYSQPVSSWTGARESNTPGRYLLTGTSGSTGLLYVGPISGSGGTPYVVSYPRASATSPYGPDVVDGNTIRIVGTYTTSADDDVHGFVFQGSLAGLANPTNYQTIDDPRATHTYVHSTMGDLAVGNSGDGPAATDHAFIYGLSEQRFLTDIVYPGSETSSTTAYGVWYNGGTSYTIAGGYNTIGSAGGGPVAEAYLVDYDAATGQFSHWTSYAGPQGVVGPSIATHFQGISGPEPGVYTMSASSTDAASATVFQGSLATVRRNPDGSFSPAYYVNLNYPGSEGIESANSVAGNQVVGVATTSTGTVSFQATVNLGFQLSNVISGNGGNGIGIYGASGNRIAMNNIGTDATGTLRRGNAGNGVLLAQGASNNMIGGTVTGGDDQPATATPPPQGNLISGNRGNGVLITGGGVGNTLNEDFVGTTADGSAPLGNGQNGVALVGTGNVTIGGSSTQGSPARGNRIIANRGYGLYAVGVFPGSVVQGNTIVANARGNVNIARARGITYIPGAGG
jgi:hypothetical protein